MRVGLTFFLSAAVPLNFFRVQNLTADNPSGSPSVVTTRLECIRMPQTVYDLRRPALSRPPLMLLVMPIPSGFSLFYVNRSEERLVGKMVVSTCNVGWSRN